MSSKAKTYAHVMVESFDGLSEKEATKRVKSLKILLQKRGDFKQLSKILQEFSRAWKERKGRVAEAVSAEPLSSKTREKMEKSLKKKGYIMEERIDPSVIGGTALYLGRDYLIDSTIRGKLKRISNRRSQNGKMAQIPHVHFQFLLLQ